jgi:hypothetical protein
LVISCRAIFFSFTAAAAVKASRSIGLPCSGA